MKANKTDALTLQYSEKMQEFKSSGSPVSIVYPQSHVL